MNTSIAEKVSAWRRESGLTQPAAADRIGVPQPTLSRIETGARFPDATTARKFADAGVFTLDDWAAHLALRASVAPVADREAA